MEQWLKIKTAGLPRWAWLLIFSGAVGVGIYIRTHQQEEEFGPEEEGVEEPTEGELSYYDGTEQGGGLAAAGLVGPAQAQITPVESPVIPEGFVDVFASQNETLQNAIGALGEREGGERVETLVEREGEGQAEREQVRREEREERNRHHKLTGGGSPKRKPHHKPPREHKKPKHKKGQNAKALNPKRHKPKRNRGGRRPRRAGLGGGVKAA